VENCTNSSNQSSALVASGPLNENYTVWPHEQLMTELSALVDSCPKNRNSSTDEDHVVQPLGAEAPRGILLETVILNADTNGGMSSSVAATQQQAMLRSLNLKIRNCMSPAALPLRRCEAAEKLVSTLADKLHNHQVCLEH
jgi:hypothetical protein